MHDGRTRLARDVEREVRSTSRAGLRHGHPAQRPDRRGAELRAAGHPPRSALRRRRRVLRAGQGGGRPWLSRPAWAAGSSAILQRLGAGRGRARRAARTGDRADRRRTPASRASSSTKRRCRRSPTRWASAGCCSRCSCARYAGGTFELVAGERRWRAAQLAGLQRIPAIVRERDDAETLEVALIENMAREDLNPVEEARAVAALVEELGLTREAVGKRVGRSRVADLQPAAAPRSARRGARAARDRARSPRATAVRCCWPRTTATRRILARAAAEQGWSVRVTEQRARDAAKDGPRRARQGAGHPAS